MPNRMTRRTALLVALLPLAACGGPYMPSPTVGPILEMDVSAIPVTVDVPEFPPAAEVEALPRGSLAWSVGRSLRDSPIARQALVQVWVAAAGVDQARSALGPNLSGEARMGYTDAGGAEDTRLDRLFGISGSVVLFDNGARRLRGERSRWAAASAAAGAYDRVEAVAGAVAESHTQALRAAEVLRLAEAQVRRFEGLLSRVRRLAAVGSANASDVPEAEARLERIRQGRTQYAQAVADAEARLRRLSGEPVMASDLARPVPPALPERPLERAEEIAAEHPSVTALDAEIRAALKAALSVDAERLGSVVAQFGPSGFMQVFGGRHVSAMGSAFLRLNLPIVDSGERMSRLRRAAAEVEVSMARREDGMRAVAQNIRTAENLRIAATETSATAERERRAAARVSRAKAADYQAGLVDLRSLLDAEQTVTDAAIRAAGANWDRLIAELRLAAATGRLAASLGAVRSRQVSLDVAAPPPPSPLLRGPDVPNPVPVPVTGEVNGG